MVTSNTQLMRRCTLAHTHCDYLQALVLELCLKTNTFAVLVLECIFIFVCFFCYFLFWYCINNCLLCLFPFLPLLLVLYVYTPVQGSLVDQPSAEGTFPVWNQKLINQSINQFFDPQSSQLSVLQSQACTHTKWDSLETILHLTFD